MAKTLTQIETLTKFYARDNDLSLTNATNLAEVNAIYRSLSSIFVWPELLQKHDLSISTTSGVKTYDWTFASSPVFVDVRAVRVGSDASDTELILLRVPETELIWSDTGNLANTVPIYYQRFDGGVNQIELRPAPSYSSATIKVTGVVEPSELTIGSSTTVYLKEATDDALAHILAASFSLRDGFNQNATNNIQIAATMLQDILRGQKVTAEDIRNLVSPR